MAKVEEGTPRRLFNGYGAEIRANLTGKSAILATRPTFARRANGRRSRRLDSRTRLFLSIIASCTVSKLS